MVATYTTLWVPWLAMATFGTYSGWAKTLSSTGSLNTRPNVDGETFEVLRGRLGKIRAGNIRVVTALQHRRRRMDRRRHGEQRNRIKAASHCSVIPRFVSDSSVLYLALLQRHVVLRAKLLSDTIKRSEPSPSASPVVRGIIHIERH